MVIRRIRYWLASRNRAAALREEMRLHVEERTAELRQTGLSEREASERASRAFGNQTLVQETAREIWVFRWMDALLQDLRYTLRTLRRNPGFTIAVTLCLGIGIGANTAIFTLMEAVIFRPLPVRAPNELVQLVHSGSEVSAESERAESSNHPLFRYIQEHARSFDGLLLVRPASLRKVIVNGVAEQLQLQQVSGNYYHVLGVPPVLGRTIAPDDTTALTSQPVAVLGFEYWQRRFGGDPNVLGRRITLDNTSYSVVGVTTKSFFGLQMGRIADVTIPFNETVQRPGWFSLAIVGRLHPGTSPAQAAAETNGIFQQFISTLTLPQSARAAGFARMDLRPAGGGLSQLKRQFTAPLMLLMGMVGLALIVASANVGSLLLARFTARRRELAVRLALGAGKGRIARQLFAEGVVLSCFGGTLGLLLAWWGSQVLASLTLEEGLARMLSAPPNARVLGFTVLVSVVTGILFTVIPSFRIRSMALASSLVEGRTAVRARPFFGRALVALQVALSVVLLAGASLFVQSLRNLRGVPTGVGDGVLGFALNADGTGYEDERLALLQTDLLQRFQALPGVEDAALTTVPPLSGNEDGKPVAVPGYEPREGENTIGNVNGVSAGYFATYDVRIVAGRAFAASDSRTSPKVIVVSESLSRHYFGSADPVGKRIGFGRLRDQPAGQAEIVGVARDALYRRNLRDAPRDMIYMPYAQMEEPSSTVAFGIRAIGNPEAITNAARLAVQALAPTALITRPRVLSEQVNEILVTERLLAALGAMFGILCLVLTAIGLYGLLAFSVARRTPEIGLRMALGAQSHAMLWSVLRESLGLVVIGAVVGAGGALILLKSASSLLYGIETTDSISIAIAIGLLITVALISSTVPAIRASRIDPVVALRYE